MKHEAASGAATVGEKCPQCEGHGCFPTWCDGCRSALRWLHPEAEPEHCGECWAVADPCPDCDATGLVQAEEAA
jgi:hypothetical protein